MSDTVKEIAESEASDVKPTVPTKQNETKEGINKENLTNESQKSDNTSSKEKLEHKMTTNNSSHDIKIENESKENKKIVKEQENNIKNKSDNTIELGFASKSLESDEHEVSPTSSICSERSSSPSSPVNVSPVVNSQPIHIRKINATAYGPYPVITHCCRCGVHCLTETRLRMGDVLCISFAAICCVSSFFSSCCLAAIPCLIEEYYDIEHECRNCHALLGEYKREC